MSNTVYIGQYPPNKSFDDLPMKGIHNGKKKKLGVHHSGVYEIDRPKKNVGQ